MSYKRNRQEWIHSLIIFLLCYITTFTQPAFAAIDTSTLELLQESTASVSLTAPFTNRRTGETRYTAILTNHSSTPITGPFVYVITAITNPHVTVVNPHDHTLNNDPGFIYPETNLEPNATLETTIIFHNAGRGRYNFTPLLYQTPIDSTDPVIIYNLSPEPNTMDWNNTDVTVTFECQDHQSGISECTEPVLFDQEGQGQTVIGSAIDQAGNTATTNVIINLDKSHPMLTLDTPLENEIVNEIMINLQGNAYDTLSGLVSLTCQGQTATVANQNYNCDVTLVAGDNTLTVQAEDLAGNINTIHRTVTLDTNAANVPPDPASVAPAINPTVATTLAAATNFIYSGDYPIQTGVALGTIEPKRVAVLRGIVTNRDGQALPGVRLTILNHPEYGQTLSRVDGYFDLVVNGGGSLILQYDKAGFLPVHRQIKTLWQDYVWVSDVTMIPLDPKTTTINLSTPEMQVAQSSVQSDQDGTRRATLLIPPGTQAEMILPDGTSQALLELSIRATEYTVGDKGPQTMPAELPPNSGYTYALEYSVDEAMQSGATDVHFNQPLYHYVENFLDFPVGSIVPTGYYDRNKTAWIPSENGRIIKILNVDTNGLANIDTTGNGLTDNDTNLGITNLERESLAGLYTAGTSLWRVPITHFTPWDCNWPYGPPPNATSPKLPAPRIQKPIAKSCQTGGSIIECQNQTLGEVITIPGTSLTLNYRSDRVIGRIAENNLQIPLSGPTIPELLKRIDLIIEVAGKKFTESFSAIPNQTYTFSWNGRDAYNRILQGTQKTKIRLGYVYDAVYYEPAEFRESFAQFGNIPITNIRARQEIILWQQNNVAIEMNDVSKQGLGGWTLDVHHIYDPIGRVIQLGNGKKRYASNMNQIIQTVAGGGFPTEGIGDNGLAIDAQLRFEFPGGDGVAVAQSGGFYIADSGNNRVRYVNPDGIISTVAGDGNWGSGGDGGLAINAQLTPTDIALGPDDSLYIADLNSNKVRRVNPEGIITTVAGNGNFSYSGDDMAATETAVTPRDVAVASDGSIYIADIYHHRIRLVTRDGKIYTVAGDGNDGFGGDGGQAVDAQMSYPAGIAVGPDGSLYIADTENRRIRRVGLDGIITTVAGSSNYLETNGDGGPAVEAMLKYPIDIAINSEGGLYIAEIGGDARYVSPDGIINTVTGPIDTGGGLGDNGPASAANIKTVSDIDVGPDGAIYVEDFERSRIRRVAPPLPGFSELDLLIPSEDGTELYQFNSVGKHQKTFNTLTGTLLYEFHYEQTGLLIGVRDGNGNHTQIERNSEGTPIAIISPDGQRTILNLATNSYLTSVITPAGRTHTMSYTEDGLLTQYIDANGNSRQYGYDSLGRLTQATDPANAIKTLTFEPFANGREVTLNDALNRSTIHRVERLATLGLTLTNIFPGGTQSTVYQGTNGHIITTLADGMVTELTEGPDPRFGMQSPIKQNLINKTPGGLTSTITTSQTASLANPDNPLSLNKQTKTINVNGRLYTNVFDAVTKTHTNTTPEGRVSETIVNAQGRVTLQQIPGLASVQYSYDTRGRLNEVSQGTGTEERKTVFSYDDQGYLHFVTDPLGRTAGFQYDLDGLVTQQTLADGRQIRYEYDANGNLITLTPPFPRPDHYFEYNEVDLPDKYNPPDMGILTDETTYEYNKGKQPTKVNRPDGKVIDFTYDNAGRLDLITTSRYRYDHTYDSNGRLSKINLNSSPPSEGEEISYTYDGSLPLTTTWLGTINGSASQRYDNNFRIISESVNNANTINFTYDNDGLLTHAGILTLNHDPDNGLLIDTNLGMVSDSWSYNAFGEPQRYTATVNNSTSYDVSFTRDKLGRIIEKNETIGTDTNVYNYDYDIAGRLIQVDKNSATISQYTYDSNGNRLSHNSTTGTYDNQDRLLSYGDTTYTYTANGELLTKTDADGTTSYDYDVMGNLRKVVLPNGDTIEYIIDGQNRRIGKKLNGTLVQGFLFADQLNPIAELDGNGDIVSRFVYGSRVNVPDYMIKNGVTYRIISDNLGSPRLIVNINDGNVAQRLDYSEFGNILIDSNPGFQPFGLGGGQYDQYTGLVRFGARDYDSQTGRWTTKDPIRFGGGINLYGYTFNNPINFIDPSGLDWQYSQSTGQLIHVNANGNATVVATEGYSGAGIGVNNPAMQNVHNIGPIPQGSYNISPQQNNVTNSGTILRASMRLIPQGGTNTFGRSGFIIHGDNRAMNRTASSGCPIFNRAIRNQISNSGDTIFTVVP